MSDKIEQFWRDATADDAENGKGCVARFRDQQSGKWFDGQVLTGWRRKVADRSLVFYDGAGVPWRFCQVYDPPQWYIDKPDPGEGWRLLEKFPHEPLQVEDDWWVIDSKDWLPSRRACRGEQQDDDVWYRRRIEPVKIESRSRDNIPTGWIKLSDDEPRLASDAYWSQGAKDWVIIGDNRVEYANRDKWPAIRQRDDLLIEGKAYALPKGLTLEVYKNGFEVY